MSFQIQEMDLNLQMTSILYCQLLGYILSPVAKVFYLETITIA